MESTDTQNLLKGTLLFAGTYLLLRSGTRLYQTLFQSSSNETTTTKDLWMREACTVSMGVSGAALVYLVYGADRGSVLHN